MLQNKPQKHGNLLLRLNPIAVPLIIETPVESLDNIKISGAQWPDLNHVKIIDYNCSNFYFETPEHILVITLSTPNISNESLIEYKLHNKDQMDSQTINLPINKDHADTDLGKLLEIPIINEDQSIPPAICNDELLEANIINSPNNHSTSNNSIVIDIPANYEIDNDFISAFIKNPTIIFDLINVEDHKFIFADDVTTSDFTFKKLIDLAKALGRVFEKKPTIEEIKTDGIQVDSVSFIKGQKNNNVSKLKEKQDTKKSKDEDEFLWSLIFNTLQPPLPTKFASGIEFPQKLYPYQGPGVCFLCNTKPGALLADDMGLGKTVQTIVALRFLFQAGRIKHALVVCPLATLSQWETEFKQWAPLLHVQTVYGLVDSRIDQWDYLAHVYLTTFGTLRSDIDYITRRERKRDKFEYDVVVIDEVSCLRNRETQQSKAIQELPKKYTWGLTGTPIENDIVDIVYIFDVLHPELFRDYRIGITTEGVKKRIEPYMLRRRKQDVLHDLPDKTITINWLDLAPQQRKAYDRAYETGVIELRRLQQKEIITVQHVLALLLKLKQICNFDPKTWHSSKIDWLNDQLHEMNNENGKVLIFSQFREFGVEAIFDKIPDNDSAALYTGGISMKEREQIRNWFGPSDEVKNDIGKNKLLLTYGAGSLGLNLQGASYVVRFDHWWNPAVENQAVDRAHRLGQKNKVIVYDLWIKDTIEEKIFNILATKRQIFDEVIDALAENAEYGKTRLSEQEAFGLFDLEPPKRKSKDI